MRMRVASIIYKVYKNTGSNMGNLTNPTYVTAVLKRFGFSFQKKYGQNFLIDDNILTRIVESADIKSDDVVLEIGPGIGTMTEELSKAASKVIAVEIDTELIPILEDTLFNCSNVTIINNDILKTDIESIGVEYNAGKPLKVVANLPYYITTPIIMELLEKKLPIESITVMVQKEVASRMMTGPGSKDYGALSLAVQYYTTPEIVCNVPASCFMPKPNVDSTVIKLTVNEECPVKVESEELLFDCIRASFNQRRKTLANGLKNYAKLGLSKEQVTEAIAKANFRPDIRGEVLTLEEFALLSNYIYEIKNS